MPQNAKTALNIRTEIYPITKCGKKEMEDVSKLDVMAKEFMNSTTMVKVTAMNINKRNVTLCSASRFQLLP